MLAKKYRLTQHQHIEKIFKIGRLVSGKSVFLKVLKNNLNVSRFAFVVSNKISKKAVMRNKIKRRLRNIVRHCLNNINQGYDIIIIAKKHSIDCCYNEIKKDLMSALAKLKTF